MNRNQNNYFEISSRLNENLKKTFANINFINLAQYFEYSWTLRLIDSFLGHTCFFAVRKFIGIDYTDEDLIYYKKNNIIFPEIGLSKINVYEI